MYAAYYGGIVKEFSMDDKGLVFIAAFGLSSNQIMGKCPPIQAASCALRISRDLHVKNVQSFIGISTGEVFVASIGINFRKEFAMIGDAVSPYTCDLYNVEINGKCDDILVFCIYHG